MTNLYWISEAVKLVGEGKYNINSVKEISVTESCLEMGRNVTGCQNDEDYEDCTTRQYMHAFLKHCECVPFSMKTKKNVQKIQIS